MLIDTLKEALKRAEGWPQGVQEEFVAIALEIDAALRGEVYCPTPEERDGIEEGLADADAGRFATRAEINAVFGKCREASRISEEERAELMASLEQGAADIVVGNFDEIGPDTLRREFDAITQSNLSDEDLDARLGIKRHRSDDDSKPRKPGPDAL